MCRSEPQTPARVIFTRTSSGPGSATGYSRISNGVRGPFDTTTRPRITDLLPPARGCRFTPQPVGPFVAEKLGLLQDRPALSWTLHHQVTPRALHESLRDRTTRPAGRRSGAGRRRHHPEPAAPSRSGWRTRVTPENEPPACRPNQRR